MSILQMSISAGGLVIATVLIRTVALNRLPKKMFLVLWGVALFRLLIPVSISLPLSVPNIVGNVFRTTLPDNSMSPVVDNIIYTGDVVTGISNAVGHTSEAT